MSHIRQMRQFVQLVDKRTKDPDDDPIQSFAMLTIGDEGAERDTCIEEFAKLYSMSESAAEEICESAIANSYIKVLGRPISQEALRLIVEPGKGRTLLTRHGFIEEWAGSLSKISSLAAVGISLAALIVSIIALVK